MKVNLERNIARYFNRSFGLLVGSGTSALYCCLKALDEQSDAERSVLFPEITCETAINAAIFAGMVPTFCDVGLNDCLPDREDFVSAASSSDCAVAVPTHIYGHLFDIPSLQTVLPNVPLIEDAAQAYGGDFRGVRAGAMGLASIVSFGEGKILDCGSGGAILTDDQSLAEECRRLIANLPSDEEYASAHRAQVMREMLEVRRAHKESIDRPEQLRRQRSILRAHKDGYLSQISSDTMLRVNQAFPLLQARSTFRRECTQEIEECLSARSDVRLIPKAGQPALWRYSFLVTDGTRDEKVYELRSFGVEASKLFSPCSAKFADEVNEKSRSVVFSKAIVNLQLAETPPAQVSLIKNLKKVFK